MSTAARGGPGQSAPTQGQAATGQQPTAPAPGTQQGATQQGAAQPVPQGQPSPAPSGQTRASSTPRRLRWARGAAAAAALLTGIVATGTFGASGVNATPNVIAQQWVAAEEAGVEIAHADLLAAQRVAAEGTEGTEGTEDPEVRATYDETVRTVGEDLTRVAAPVGSDASAAARAARPWSEFVIGVERAAATSDANAYGTASETAQEAATVSDELAGQHAYALRTGSRSAVTAVVGTAATAIMAYVLIWLALRTRRIVNVPLLIATGITAGLTYISLNPSALPVDYDQRIGEATATATALEDVYQARQAQHAVVLGLADRLDDTAGQAQDSVDALGVTSLSGWWDEVDQAREAQDGGAVSEETLASSQDSFDSLETELRERLDGQLEGSAAAVGRPAAITSGVALLLGLAAAALAWTGLSQRLRDYR